MIQLREDQLTQLDAQAHRSGKSRAQIIREAVDSSLPTGFDQELADRYAAAYPEQTSGTDEWGSLDAWHSAAAAAREHLSDGENGLVGVDEWA